MEKVHEQEADSEEECEVYFLKPVNEYNIVDKIKAANKELFALNVVESSESSVEINCNRKVTFATQLEDYAPDRKKEDSKVLNENESKSKAEVNNYKEVTQLEAEIAQVEKEIAAETAAEIEKEVISSIYCGAMDDVDLEEICEEIIVMDMAEKPIAPSSSVESLTHRMIKQATFDYTNNDDMQQQLHVEMLAEGDASPTNFEQHIDEESYEDKDEGGEEEEDEDDQLSIIVASYLPNDYNILADDITTDSTNERLKVKSRRLLPSKKRLSFRHRTTNSNTFCSHTRGLSNTPESPKLVDLKLNYKICCEHRRAAQQEIKLPKYSGYLSEYGLSREQLAEREQLSRQKERSELDKVLKSNEQQVRKMQDNERAFTNWLRNKMRFPTNKTKNMFDVKTNISFGESGFKLFGGATKRKQSCRSKK